jgi:subtilisin family serine protease
VLAAGLAGLGALPSRGDGYDLRCIEPACARIWEAQATGESLTEDALRDSPVRAPQRALLAQGRIRLQLDTGPGGAPAASIEDACRARVPSLRWEGSAGSHAQVSLAIADLPRLAQVPGLCYAMRPPRGLALVTSDGVAAIGAPDYHARGLDGSGLRIGVLDLGFAGLEDLRGEELNPETQARAFAGDPGGSGDLANGTAHGTACAEIVQDVAPGAQLFLANANTDVELQAAVRWLIAQDVAIISYSVGWFYGAGDGTGRLAEIVEEALDVGVLWVNAAGNQAQAHWGGAFADADEDDLNEFGDGDETISYAAGQGGDDLVFTLTWDAWPYSLDAAFDLEIYEDDELVATSRTTPASIYAYRDIDYRRRAANSRIDVRVRRTLGTRGARLSLFRADGELLPEHRVVSGSLLMPADVARVLSIGAYRLETGELEDFSSRGPTLDGRPKPELCGPDGIETATFTRFLGTSAACPHAAGAAALLLAAAPGGGLTFRWTIEEQRSFFATGAQAVDFGDANACAWGRLHLPSADSVHVPVAPLSLRGASPSRAPIALAVTAPAAGTMLLRIHDIAGRLLWEERVARGAWVWNGLDRYGSSCPAGVYLIDLSAGNERVTRRLILLR